MTGDDLEAELLELRDESAARSAELRALAAELPQVTSRRAQLKAIAASVAKAPDRPTVAKRALLKALRTPRDLVRKLRAR